MNVNVHLAKPVPQPPSLVTITMSLEEAALIKYWLNTNECVGRPEAKKVKTALWYSLDAAGVPMANHIGSILG